MRSKVLGSFLLGLVLVTTLSISARPPKPDHDNDDRDRDNRDRDSAQCRDEAQLEHNRKTPVSVIGVVPIPGNPVTSSDLIFADSGTEKVYFSDRSNFGVDVLDAENSVFVGRIPGFAGPNSLKPPNGQGPNGVLATKNKQLWVGDGNSTLEVADIDPSHTSPLTYLTIVHSISTNNAECDDGTNHKCNRADELGWDPADHMILVANDQPSPVGTLTHADPYGTFVSTDTFTVLGQVMFPAAGGAEQPVWDPQLNRFLVTLPGTAASGTTPFQQARIAIIKAGASSVESYYNLGDITGIANCTSANGLALGSHQHILASACGSPVVLDALNGHLINVITQVGGGDEVWANPGDERFYVASTDKTSALTPLPAALGVIDEESGKWLQNVDAPGAAEPTAFAETNHMFTSVRTATPDNTVCAQFGDKGTGCIAIYVHAGSDPDNH